MDTRIDNSRVFRICPRINFKGGRRHDIWVRVATQMVRILEILYNYIKNNTVKQFFIKI